MARQVNFGLWYDFRNPQLSSHKTPPPSFETLYKESVAQIAWAETLGFDSVWLTEHHFVDDGYTPSPLVLAAAIGQATSKMQIGTNLLLLPLADPIRIAEDAAALSILTNGRFDLGIGIGYRELEFDYFGRKLNHRPSLMEEGVDILRQAWSGKPVHVDGKRYTIDGLTVAPRPSSPPRILMGGMAEPAIARAARLGDGFLSTGGIGHDLYVAALAAAGKSPEQGAIFAGHWGIIADDPEREAAIVGECALYQTNQYVRWGAFGPPDQVPEFPDAESAMRDGLYELMDGAAAINSLTEMLTTYPQIKDVHFWAQFPGESIESGSRRMEYLAQHVLPQVRANIA